MRFKFVGGPYDGDEDKEGSPKVMNDRWVSMICAAVPADPFGIVDQKAVTEKLNRGELPVALYYLDYEHSTDNVICWRHWKIVMGNPTMKQIDEILNLSDSTRPT